MSCSHFRLDLAPGPHVWHLCFKKFYKPTSDSIVLENWHIFYHLFFIDLLIDTQWHIIYYTFVPWYGQTICCMYVTLISELWLTPWLFNIRLDWRGHRGWTLPPGSAGVWSHTALCWSQSTAVLHSHTEGWGEWWTGKPQITMTRNVKTNLKRNSAKQKWNTFRFTLMQPSVNSLCQKWPCSTKHVFIKHYSKSLKFTFQTTFLSKCTTPAYFLCQFFFFCHLASFL